MSMYRAVATIGVMSGWTVSNLSMQKLLYLSHMYAIGHGGVSLIEGFRSFQAWELGPVQPELYHKVKAFGTRPIPSFNVKNAFEGDEKPYRYINRIMEQVGSSHPDRLVAITHWEMGAWAKNYESGRRNIDIPNEDIIEEYRKRRKQIAR